MSASSSLCVFPLSVYFCQPLSLSLSPPTLSLSLSILPLSVYLCLPLPLSLSRSSPCLFISVCLFLSLSRSSPSLFIPQYGIVFQCRKMGAVSTEHEDEERNSDGMYFATLSHNPAPSQQNNASQGQDGLSKVNLLWTIIPVNLKFGISAVPRIFVLGVWPFVTSPHSILKIIIWRIYISGETKPMKSLCSNPEDKNNNNDNNNNNKLHSSTKNS